MSNIKDLFTNNKIKKFGSSKTSLSGSKDAESPDMVIAKNFEKNRFIPPIDFTTASNFAKYGSAELYYEYSFKRIQDQYPYDGTLAEIQQYENSSSYLDKYVFDNIYPRTNGYVNMGIQGFSGGGLAADASGFYDSAVPEYIYIQGGPHTASGGMAGKKLANTFDNSTYYDTASNRASNLQFTALSGATVEFWMKKRVFDSAKAQKEVIFDLYNQEASGSTYGRFRIWLSSSATAPIHITFVSGAINDSYDLANGSLTTGDVADDKWHHYAISIASTGSNSMRTRLYRDGAIVSEMVNIIRDIVINMIMQFDYHQI